MRWDVKNSLQTIILKFSTGPIHTRGSSWTYQIRPTRHITSQLSGPAMFYHPQYVDHISCFLQVQKVFCVLPVWHLASRWGDGRKPCHFWVVQLIYVYTDQTDEHAPFAALLGLIFLLFGNCDVLCYALLYILCIERIFPYVNSMKLFVAYICYLYLNPHCVWVWHLCVVFMHFTMEDLPRISLSLLLT